MILSNVTNNNNANESVDFTIISEQVRIQLQTQQDTNRLKIGWSIFGISLFFIILFCSIFCCCVEDVGHNGSLHFKKKLPFINQFKD